jgi:hypothetical protein
MFSPVKSRSQVPLATLQNKTHVIPLSETYLLLCKSPDMYYVSESELELLTFRVCDNEISLATKRNSCTKKLYCYSSAYNAKVDRENKEYPHTLV